MRRPEVQMLMNANLEGKQRMVAIILNRCFNLSEEQVSFMGEGEAIELLDAYVKYHAEKYSLIKFANENR